MYNDIALPEVYRFSYKDVGGSNSGFKIHPSQNNLGLQVNLTIITELTYPNIYQLTNFNFSPQHTPVPPPVLGGKGGICMWQLVCACKSTGIMIHLSHPTHYYPQPSHKLSARQKRQKIVCYLHFKEGPKKHPKFRERHQWNKLNPKPTSIKYFIHM